MKKFIKRMTGFILSMSMVLSLPTITFAEEIQVVSEISEIQEPQTEANVLQDKTNESADLTGVSPYGIPDSKAPEVTSMILYKSEVAAGGSIPITGQATDDVSGVSSIYAHFIDDESGKQVGASLSDIVYDPNTGEQTHTGNFEGEIDIPKYTPTGTFELYYISVSDIAGNSKIYWRDSNFEGIAFPSAMKFKVTEEIPDTVCPELKSIHIEEKDPILTGSTITITGTVSDDLSGVRYVDFTFRNPDNNRSYSQVAYDTEYDQETGKEIHTGSFKASIKILEQEPEGTFELTDASVVDIAGNKQQYVKNLPDYESDLKKLPNDCSFVVESINPDNTPPILKEIGIDKESVEAPGIVTITATAEDDSSGVNYIDFVFINSENGRQYGRYMNDKVYDYETGETIHTGIFTTTINISEFEPEGTFELTHVYVYDETKNQQIYLKDPSEYDIIYGHLKMPQDASFIVKNIPGSGVNTSTTSPDLLEKITGMPEGETAHINYGQDSNLPQNVFDSIAGKDKNIVLESSGIQWEFNGKDIGENATKPIDLNVGINKLEHSPSENREEISEIVKDKPAVVLSFAENGELPGKAKMRVKADWVFKDLGTEGLYIYYYDNTTKKFVNIAEDLKVTPDGYLEFEITHNSDFVVTKGNIDDPPTPPTDPDPPTPPTDPDPPTPPTPPVTPPSLGNVSVMSPAPYYGNTSADRDSNSSTTVTTKSTGKVFSESQAQLLLKQAKDKGTSFVTAKNMDSIPAATLKLVGKSGKQLQADTTSNGKLIGRLYIDAAKTNKTIQPKISLSPKATTAKAKKSFKDAVVIELAQKGSYGTPVKVAVKANVKGMRAENLKLYYYDSKKDMYTPLQNQKYFIDQNGFLHFEVLNGGVIVVTEQNKGR